MYRRSSVQLDPPLLSLDTFAPNSSTIRRPSGLSSGSGIRGGTPDPPLLPRGILKHPAGQKCSAAGIVKASLVHRCSQPSVFPPSRNHHHHHPINARTSQEIIRRERPPPLQPPLAAFSTNTFERRSADKVVGPNWSFPPIGIGSPITHHRIVSVSNTNNWFPPRKASAHCLGTTRDYHYYGRSPCESAPFAYRGQNFASDTFQPYNQSPPPIRRMPNTIERRILKRCPQSDLSYRLQVISLPSAPKNPSSFQSIRQKNH